MNPVEAALWFVEANLTEVIALKEIAEAAGVSRFHLSRAFATATGHPVMRYLRSRRLTEAARALSAGAPDILCVAFDAGYGSHEAFTRAFREQFGLTPEGVRARGHLDTLALVEPIRMDATRIVDLPSPRFETGRPLLVAGIRERCNVDSDMAIQSQWQRFAPHIGHVPGQVGTAAYGVCYNIDESGNFDYIAGVEVSGSDNLPPDLAPIRIPAQRYAVFTHRDHILSIRNTIYTIWNKWLPESGHDVVEAPEFELYDERFNPMTGMGEVEIWIPVKA